MAGQKLAATKIDRYKPTKDDEVLADGNGLYIRFRKQKDGKYSRTWMYTYKVGKSSAYLTLGEHDSSLTSFENSIYRLEAQSRLTLEVARRISAELNTLRKKGLDPKTWLQHEHERAAAAKAFEEQELARKKAEEEAYANRLTVKGLHDIWFAGDPSNRKDGGKEIARCFRKHVNHIIGGMPADDVSRANIMSVLDPILQRGHNRLANMILGDLRQMYEFAVDREIVKANPCARIRKEKVGGRDVMRKRNLTVAEVLLLAKALKTVKLGKRTEPALWIMMSTLCRVGEITRARWANLDLEAGTWTIPHSDAKNKTALTIPLSDFAKRQFAKLKELKTHDVWILPHRTLEDTHQSIFTISRQFRDNQYNVAPKGRNFSNKLCLPGGHWHSHDLRRTGATLMGGLGVSKDVIERCLNHTESDKLKQIYQQQEQLKEQAHAWRVLGDHLDVLLGAAGDNVSILHRPTQAAA